ncbi:protein FAM53C isoform X1 [Esox lucius]|uniref:Family with sequence similarity 53 member C n=2 Tax=Esox lucius TaxID=8010 RepID=A0AAY5JZI1_ESOLU|nr:protein FAM53C isoform X1 [Esox lucius]
MVPSDGYIFNERPSPFPCCFRLLRRHGVQSMPEVGSSPPLCWSGYGLTPESSWSVFPSSKNHLQDASFLGPLGTPLPLPSTSLTDLSLQSSPPPPPPPPKRHCRSLSVPEDLSRCRTPWRPSASKIWTPVKRRCHSGGGVSGPGIGSVGSVPLLGLSSSLTSSLRSSSSPTFFSLALSPDSPLPWSFPLDQADTPRVCCSGFFPTPSSCSSSPAPFGSCRPLQRRRFSLSPVHMLPPRPSPAPVPRYPGTETPVPSPSPSSACSTPSSSRRVLPPCLPRCHSQPCDMRKPGLKRRHEQDTLPYCARPGLDFSKMTQIGSGEPLVCATAVCMSLEPGPGDFRGSFCQGDLLGRTSIGPLSESEEEEEEEEEENNTGVLEAGQQSVFERDCTELDLNLIEEN